MFPGTHGSPREESMSRIAIAFAAAVIAGHGCAGPSAGPPPPPSPGAPPSASDDAPLSAPTGASDDGIWGAGMVLASGRDGATHLFFGRSEETLRAVVADSGYQYGPAWSHDGEWIVYASTETGASEVFRVRPDGTGKTRLTDREGYDGNASYSPTGDLLVFVSTRDSIAEGHAGRDLWLMDADGGILQRLTRNDLYEGAPRFSPDGTRIAFCRQVPTAAGPDGEIFTLDLASGEEVRVTDAPGFDCLPDWSPDGSRLAYHRCGEESCGIFVAAPDGSGERRVSPDSVPGQWPRWSPDGVWIAYTSTREEQTDIWAVRVADGAVRRLTSGPLQDEVAAWRPVRREP